MNTQLSPTTDMSVPENMLRLLPSPPARVLLIGAGFEAIASTLTAHGYSLTYANGFSLETFPGTVESVNDLQPVVIVGELAPEIDALTLFSGSHDALAMGGLLVLLGPAVQQAAIAARRGVNQSDYLSIVAARHGFSVVSDADSGLYVYAKTETPRWRLSRAQERDTAPVLALFHEVFGHPMSSAHREWKYGEGRGFSVLARHEGKIVAHFGGLIRRVLVSGKPCDAFQICDVMVESKERAVLTRLGPFFLTAVSFAESGKTARALLGYGFPSSRAMRLAEKLGIYLDVGGMAEIRWQPLSDRPRLWTRARHLSPVATDTDIIINCLWRQMAEDLRGAVVGARDSRYVRHRYFEHPDKRYDVVLVTNRFGGNARGILVLRRDEDLCELLDVIAPLKNLPILLDQARRLLSHWGLREMYCWITQQNAALFTASGGTEHPLEIRIPTCSWVDGPELQALRDKWWLMSGDTDFR
jgi:hypothetical protein